MELRGVIVVEDPVGRQAAARPWPVTAIEQVANRPIALHVLDALQSVGIAVVVVVSSARSARAVRECLARREHPERTRLHFVQRRAPIDLASALSLVAPIAGGSAYIVHAGCGLLAESLAALAQDLDEGADVVLAVHQSSTPDQRLSPEIQTLLGLAELDPVRSPLGIAGVWAFGEGMLARAVTRPGAGTPDLATLAGAIRGGGGKIDVRRTAAWHAYRGDAADLLELNRIVLDQIETDLPHGIRDTNRIEGRVQIRPGATVRDSVLIGPVVIGADAHIIDAYIGPYTAIGNGACIEGAEVERSIVAGGARLTHVGRRLTDSVIGRNARVFRDFSLPQALRLRLGDDTEVGLC